MSRLWGIYHEHDVSQIIQAWIAIDKDAIASSCPHDKQAMFLSKQEAPYPVGM